MKKFGRKLVLSGLALAATAATLSTSTYAWYVANDTAKVTGANTATTGGEVGGNLLVAANKVVEGNDTADTYSNKADIANGLAKITLDPVHMLADGTFVDDAKEAVDEADACQVFKFWVLSSEKTTIYISTTATNITETDKIVQQTSFNASHSAGSTAVNSKFYVDAANSLRYSVQIGEGATAKYYDHEKFTTSYTAYTAADATKEIAESGLKAPVTGGNAHDYYNAILGEPAPYLTDEVSIETAELTEFTVEKGVETLITIKVWLEGADTDCFDSCRGQKFSYVFDLTGTKS